MRRVSVVLLALLSFSLVAKADSIRVGDCYFGGCYANSSFAPIAESQFNSLAAGQVSFAALFDLPRNSEDSASSTSPVEHDGFFVPDLGTLERSSRERRFTPGGHDEFPFPRHQGGAVAVPEPSNWMLLLLGISGMVLLYRGRSTPRS